MAFMPVDLGVEEEASQEGSCAMVVLSRGRIN